MPLRAMVRLGVNRRRRVAAGFAFVILLMNAAGAQTQDAGDAGTAAAAVANAQAEVGTMAKEVGSAVSGDPALAAHRRLMSDQGFAEEADIGEALVQMGLLNESGQIVDCSTTGRVLRAWVDTSESLTRAYLGAQWLEEWAVACVPGQTVTWADEDIERLVQALGRAGKRLPPAWSKAAAIFENTERMRQYLIAINRAGGLAVRDRTCERRALIPSATPMTALAKTLQQCREHGTRYSVEDPMDGVLLLYRTAPFAADFYTPLWGLSALTAPPGDIAKMTRHPKTFQLQIQALAQVASPLPTMVELVDHEQHILAAKAKQRPDSSIAEERYGQEAHTQTVLLSAAAPVLENNQWPDPDECTRTRHNLLAFLHDGTALLPTSMAVHELELLDVTCYHLTTPALDGLTTSMLAATLQRIGEHMPSEWREARQALGAPNLAEKILAEARADLNPARLACLRNRVAAAHAEQLPPGNSLMRARARCAPFYPDLRTPPAS